MKIHTELNRYFEIIGLLDACARPRVQERESWERAAEELGLDARELSRAVSPLPQRYIDAFQKAAVLEAGQSQGGLFAGGDEDFVLLLQAVCGTHPEWFEGGLERTEPEEITRAFVRVLAEEGREPDLPLDAGGLIGLLRGAGHSDATCWKLLLLLQSPKEHIRRLAELVQTNLDAYGQALAAAGPALERALKAFPKGEFFCGRLCQGGEVFPTLICPALELVSTAGTQCVSYVGLFAGEVKRLLEQRRTAREAVLPALKALGDGSKFDILLSLGRAPKYNLELAEELGLTPATVSHHMSTLLILRLVQVEKRDGRVYYTLARDALRQVIRTLNGLFLPGEG